MSEPHPLVFLVDDMDLFGAATWNRRHMLLKRAVPVSAFIDEAEIQQVIDTPLLRRPYFSVLKDGVWADPDRVTRTECVNGHEITGLASPQGIRAALDQGGTLKLNQLEDWHKPTRDLVRELSARVPAEIKSYVFYTPRENTGMRPHRDGSHVLAVQLAGVKEWRLYATPELVNARAGLVDVEPDACTDQFTMEPGDVLYLPHGYPHAPHAHDQDSLHFTLTLTEPGPIDLVEALLETFREDSAGLIRQQVRMHVEDKAEAVAKAISLHADTVEEGRLLAAALGRMRRRIA
jgi:hypothetical protein